MATVSEPGSADQAEAQALLAGWRCCGSPALCGARCMDDEESHRLAQFAAYIDNESANNSGLLDTLDAARAEVERLRAEQENDMTPQALAERVEYGWRVTAERDLARSEVADLRRQLGQPCPTPCDDDCTEILCHEEHQVTWKRVHAVNHHADLRALQAEVADLRAENEQLREQVALCGRGAEGAVQSAYAYRAALDRVGEICDDLDDPDMGEWRVLLVNTIRAATVVRAAVGVVPVADSGGEQ